MKSIFKNLGYKLFTSQEKGTKKVKISYISNPDGSIRWFWNESSKNPLFLKFYNISTVKAKIFSIFIKMVFAFRLQKIVFRKKTFYYRKSTENSIDLQKDWAIFTGTIGPNNKSLLFANGYFYKIANTESAKKLINTEFKSLEIVKSNNSIITPSASMVNENMIKLLDISEGGIRDNSFGVLHSNALKTLSEKTQSIIKVSDWDYFQKLKKEFLEINDERIPKNLVKKTKVILRQIDENQAVELNFSHGDFTSWNCYKHKHKLAIYDWELSSMERPKAFDFFHFIIQNGILIQRKSWKDIYEEIKEKNTMAFQFEENELNNYLKFYLLINTLSYLKIYAEQKVWHTQIHWLLETWTDALNLFLTENYTERELLIMDIFDMLYPTNYAALKFHNEEPEKLIQNSDIDIITTRKNEKSILLFLNRYSLTKSISVIKKSFMQSVRIVTKQNEILNLDIIHQLKWKYLQIMNVDEVLENKTQNEFGVKKVSEKDTARFIQLFYVLNETEIPEIYKNLVYNNLELHSENKKTITKTLKMKNDNQGFNFLKNILNYIKDSFAAKGFIITFSGVDGAGKSTVISEVSELIEKRYRRPVKVLRHRPSLLPILSVYTKGSEKAQQDVINSLPRQGSNKNSLSSFLRFAYYYTDYIFGQFVIYLKYVLRGKIVLYDRYYFDFIADPRRSNIQLPKNLTETGYHLLMKPKFNFFLYAEPERILSRKKELSYQSICNLTKEYSQLFSKLRNQNQKSKYLSIENNDLDTTLGTIMNTIIATK